MKFVAFLSKIALLKFVFASLAIWEVRLNSLTFEW